MLRLSQPLHLDPELFIKATKRRVNPSTTWLCCLQCVSFTSQPLCMSDVLPHLLFSEALEFGFFSAHRTKPAVRQKQVQLEVEAVQFSWPLFI